LDYNPPDKNRLFFTFSHVNEGPRVLVRDFPNELTRQVGPQPAGLSNTATWIKGCHNLKLGAQLYQNQFWLAAIMGRLACANGRRRLAASYLYPALLAPILKSKCASRQESHREPVGRGLKMMMTQTRPRHEPMASRRNADDFQPSSFSHHDLIPFIVTLATLYFGRAAWRAIDSDSRERPDDRQRRSVSVPAGNERDYLSGCVAR
jgi:hypothetical protein